MRIGDAARERHLRLEVRIARTCSDDAARRDIDVARSLAGSLAPVREMWARGEISGRHVHAALHRAGAAAPDVVDAVLVRVLPRLPRTASNHVGRMVNRALAAIDPAGQAARAHVARRHDVGVRFRSLPDGLAQVVATHKGEDARAIMECLDSRADQFLAHRRACRPCADAVAGVIGPARAPVHVALVLGADREPPTGHESAQSVLPVDRLAPSAGSCGSTRRMVTDPVTGHLLDYGTRVYLPGPLRRFVAARDGTCRTRSRGQPAARSQLDHVVPLPVGPGSATHGRAARTRDHDSKIDGDIVITDCGADGSSRWRTRDGQVAAPRPRPYLNDPRTSHRSRWRTRDPLQHQGLRDAEVFQLVADLVRDEDRQVDRDLGRREPLVGLRDEVVDQVHVDVGVAAPELVLDRLELRFLRFLTYQRCGHFSTLAYQDERTG